MNYYKINTPTISAEILDNEVLAVNLITGRYYNFKNTGVIFWRLLIDGYSTESAIQKVSKFYSVDESIIKADLINFVNELLNNQLLVQTTNIIVAQNSNWLKGISGKYSKPLVEIHTDMEDLVELGSI